MSKRNYTVDEWLAEGRRLFGDDILQWRFKCPACGNVASIQDFKNAGAKHADDAAKNCIGRFVGDRGCDWAAYGLFDICDVHVDGSPVFDFDRGGADAGEQDQEAGSARGREGRGAGSAQGRASQEAVSAQGRDTNAARSAQGREDRGKTPTEGAREGTEVRRG